MKKITYKKLMEKVENGGAEINAWSQGGEGQVVDVTFHTMRSSKREYVVVTAIPADPVEEGVNPKNDPSKNGVKW